ncbi:hypothetical protein CK215_24190 [Mesorhizobium sp. WSM3864]|nr:hypothetical protein A9K66_01110 [Mesorhizobium sp. AA23]PBB90030.1 hypothetical protein CK215_24190 [Mesorhizobium sp. WSM3864]
MMALRTTRSFLATAMMASSWTLSGLRGLCGIETIGLGAPSCRLRIVVGVCRVVRRERHAGLGQRMAQQPLMDASRLRLAFDVVIKGDNP